VLLIRRKLVPLQFDGVSDECVHWDREVLPLGSRECIRALLAVDDPSRFLHCRRREVLPESRCGDAVTDVWTSTADEPDRGWQGDDDRVREQHLIPVE